MLFGAGDIRRMADDDHRDYRKALVRAIRSPDADAGVAEFGEIVTRALGAYAADSSERAGSSEAFAATTRAMATELLVRVFFGARVGSPAGDRLIAGYRELGPYGLVWNSQQRQIVAYATIRDQIRADLADLARGDQGITSTCIAAVLEAQGALDEAMLGNLITMVDMGRSDVQVLLRWLTRYAAQHPAIVDQIALDQIALNQSSPTEQGRSLAEAFVTEVLRTDQSERLERRARHDIHFEGHFIAAGTFVRLCLWESHHDEGSFADPFRFDPQRFTGSMPAADTFAPFGLDHHKCPFADLTIRLGTQYLLALARGYRVELSSDGEPYRGAYHWEPPRRLAAELVAR
ncbi:unannotated protein [freshwater metagenome]|uniref:Unannotated protein n=1 Tax=freshwater metagenome TaxID=449393 RepID=A0A6J7EYG4_9ZZZZ